MVYTQKDRAQRQFLEWLHAKLDTLGVDADRGRGAWLAKRFKISATAANKWLRGETMPDSARMLAMVRDLERIGDQDLTELEAYQIISTNSKRVGVAENSLNPISTREIAAGYVRLPLLQMEAGMGLDVYSDDPLEVVDHLDVAEWWAQANLPRPYSRIQIITGRGDSNAGVINHGDIVFVDTKVNYFDGEGFYVFNWRGRPLIKRLVPNLRSGNLQIISANPAYPPEEITGDEIESLHVAGRVVAWYTLRTH